MKTEKLIKHLLKENLRLAKEVDSLDYDVKYWKQQTLNAENSLKDCLKYGGTCVHEVVICLDCKECNELYGFNKKEENK